MEKYDGLHVIVLRSYISVSYTETYGDIRRKKRSFTVLVHGGRTQVKESDNESDRIQPSDKIRSNPGLWTDIRIPSVGIRWDPSVEIRRNLSVGFDRPLQAEAETLLGLSYAQK